MILTLQRLLKTGVALAALFWATAAASPALAQTYEGISSTGGSPGLRATLSASGSGLTRDLAFVEIPVNATAPVRSYDVDMTTRMHLIVVSDDFAVFLHLHPVLGSDGRFRITTRFPRPALYHLYADAVPSGFGHRVFRFDVDVDARASPEARHAGPRHDAVEAGPYVVRLSATRFNALRDVPIVIAITKDGKSASDLHTYLGAYAHIVVIGFDDLSYTHVHAMGNGAMATDSNMNMSATNGEGEHMPTLPANATVPATMTAHVMLPHRGKFKMWIQFAGGGSLRVAPFILAGI